MYFKIRRADGEIFYLPLKINRDEWNTTVDEQGLVTIIDAIDCKGLQSTKSASKLKNKKHDKHRKASH